MGKDKRLGNLAMTFYTSLTPRTRDQFSTTSSTA
ncbi:hypothetical protein SAMN05444158_4585 [Bradyrhizobium canariense]|uniref:Uncharacterized protein n=1 Tax=Bradyrhizobium canariense TaxID=255045 RepID=A0A1H1Y117_9BRAD|nr:hypothetical protein SAMN05444158_4585 [Bradyrhizobium canariense]